ncbi:MAG: PIN domain-containing protein [Balneolaceae bacterium]
MIYKILADVNVCLDLYLDRKPHVDFSGQIFELAEKEKIKLYISGISFDTLFYIMRPVIGPKKSTENLKQLLLYTKAGNLDHKTVECAIHAGWRDLEDALQYYCALNNGCDFLVTRNKGDFTSGTAQIDVVSPKEFLEIYSHSGR